MDSRDADPLLPSRRASPATSRRRPTAASSPVRPRSLVLAIFVLPSILLLLWYAHQPNTTTNVGTNAKTSLRQKWSDGWSQVKAGWAHATRWGFRQPGVEHDQHRLPSMQGYASDDDAERLGAEEGATLEVDLRPWSISHADGSRRGSDDPTEKYIGYLPHSGFHNQRAALQNALYLGALLNRTVLVPPVWIGWPTGLEFYDELQHSWTSQVSMHPLAFDLPANSSSLDDPLFLPASYPSTALSFPSYTGVPLAIRQAQLAALRADKAKHWHDLGYSMRPDGYPLTNRTQDECKSFSPECRGTFKDTWIAWSEIVDLEAVEESGVVRIKDRWDMRERAVERLLGIEKKDILVFTDADRYDFQFVDHHTPRGAPPRPLISNSTLANHFIRTVSIPTMRKLPQKLVLVGSLFGSQRVFSERKPSKSWDALVTEHGQGRAGTTSELKGSAIYDFIASKLSFSSRSVLDPARKIRDELGGSDAYVGIHARVGDGIFYKNRLENMWEIWRRVSEIVGVEARVRDKEEVRIRRQVEEEKTTMEKRNAEDDEGDSDDFFGSSEDEEDERAFEEAVDRPIRFSRQLRPSDSPRPGRTVSARSIRSTNLTCRGPLHTTPSLLPYNTPVYLATDSPSPTTSEALAPFFASFPCLFLLSNFDHVPELDRMKKLVNKVDGVELGRLFLPFLEATVASMGRQVVGTRASTFSAYAETTLHHAFVTNSP
ncbi:hypothetical protein JCM10212_004656 [Sporobolomyces blumeae]